MAQNNKINELDYPIAFTQQNTKIKKRMAQEPFLVTCTADEWFQEPESLSKMENLQVTEMHP